MINLRNLKKQTLIKMGVSVISSNKVHNIQQVYEYGSMLINQGEKPAKIRKEIINKGYDEHSATIIVHNLYELKHEAQKDTAKRNVLYGVIWLIGGTALTFLGNSIFGLAILFGTFELLYGLFLLKKCKK